MAFTMRNAGETNEFALECDGEPEPTTTGLTHSASTAWGTDSFAVVREAKADGWVIVEDVAYCPGHAWLADA